MLVGSGHYAGCWCHHLPLRSYAYSRCFFVALRLPRAHSYILIFIFHFQFIGILYVCSCLFSFSVSDTVCLYFVLSSTNTNTFSYLCFMIVVIVVASLAIMKVACWGWSELCQWTRLTSSDLVWFGVDSFRQPCISMKSWDQDGTVNAFCGDTTPLLPTRRGSESHFQVVWADIRTLAFVALARIITPSLLRESFRNITVSLTRILLAAGGQVPITHLLFIPRGWEYTSQAYFWLRSTTHSVPIWNYHELFSSAVRPFYFHLSIYCY